MSSKTEKAPTGPIGIRLHELAKEMGVPSKALVEKATELGIKVKSHASILTPGQADRLRAKFLGSLGKLKAGVEESKTRVVTSKRKPAVKGSKALAEDGDADHDGSTAVAEAEHTEEAHAEAHHAETEEHEAEAPVAEAEPVAHVHVEAPPASVEAPAVETPAAVSTPVIPAVEDKVVEAPATAPKHAEKPKSPFGVVSPAPPAPPAPPVVEKTTAPAAQLTQRRRIHRTRLRLRRILQRMCPAECAHR